MKMKELWPKTVSWWLLFSACLAITNNMSAQESWTRLATDHRAVEVLHSAVLVVGEFGKILKSTDNGSRWEQVDVKVSSHLNGIGALENGRVIVVGDHGSVLTSDDRGHSWLVSSIGRDVSLRGISMSPSGSVLIVGDSGTVFRSGLGGFGFDAVGGHRYADLRSVAWLNDARAVIVGDSGLVLRSDDTGKSWSKINVGASADFKAIGRIDDRIVLIAGDSGIVLRSVDTGHSWSQVVLPIVPEGVPNLRALAAQGSRVVIAGFGRRAPAMLESIDGGSTWRITHDTATGGFYMSDSQRTRYDVIGHRKFNCEVQRVRPRPRAGLVETARGD